MNQEGIYVRSKLQSNAAPASYRVEHHGNCILVFGAVPLSRFGKLTKLVPKDSIIDAHLARIAGASFAMGPREETKALIASMSGVAIENAQVLYAATGLSDDRLARQTSAFMPGKDSALETSLICANVTQ